ncbi:MAG: hypothetical protein RL268_821 [Pseudomonadota bacterium]|jgi:hypothetical protein
MTGFRRRTLRPAMLIPILMAALYLGPSIAMPYLWLDLRSVRVSDAPTAFQAKVDVDRVTRLGFFGRYTVSVRRASDDLQVCLIQSPSFDYKPGLSAPLTDRPLSWWMQGYPPLVECVRDGFASDRFYLTTCHDVLMLRAISIARRCVRSNDFTLGDEP